MLHAAVLSPLSALCFRAGQGSAGSTSTSHSFLWQGVHVFPKQHIEESEHVEKSCLGKDSLHSVVSVQYRRKEGWLAVQSEVLCYQWQISLGAGAK